MTLDNVGNSTGLCYQIYSFGSPEIKRNEDLIIHTLNKGYNIPRFKFNIITTPRIKHSLSEDLCIEPADQSFAIFCFVDGITKNTDIVIDANELIDDGETTKKKLLNLYPIGSIDSDSFKIKYDVTVPNLKNIQECKIPENQDGVFTNGFLGMACLKPYHHGTESDASYELTGFISFYPGIGSKLIKQVEDFARNVLHAKSIWVTAIEEHLLRSMYDKFGYNFVERVHVPLCGEEGAVEDKHLENDIGASQDFHLEVMCKSL